MSSPVRSVIVRLAMDPSSYVAGAARAERSTLALEGATARAGATTATSMERAAAGATKAEGSLGKLNKTVGVLGISMGGLAGVGGAVAAALSVKWAGDYQSALTKLVTTAGESEENIGSVGQAFLDMAGQVGISADEIAKGAYIAESAGYHGADAVTVMKAATQGAAQEQADLGKVTDATSTILHDYHLKASDAAKVTSQLVTAVSHGKTTFDELTGSLHSVTPLAAKMGISLADVTGTLSAMTASGMSADQATQNMANTLQHLAAPTGTMISELAQLGISTDDLATSLSSRGLAGTLQMVEEAIVKHLDPATQRVLLPALNKSKTAAQDLQIMLGQMPAPLRKLSQGFLDGSVALSDYRKDARDLGGTQAAMGTQFMSLVTSSQGFNNEIKAGRPAAQVFTAAMQKAFGTTAALNVALQTTGENAGFTNAAIKDIAGASAQADGSIKGWSEVQATFNQRLHEFEAGAKSLAIEAGQHLLPVLTAGLGWLDDHGPAILSGLTTGLHGVETVLHPLVSAGEGAVHLFGQLPGPVKDTALALLGLKIAMKINFLGVSSAVTGVKASFVGLREEMALQQALFAAEQRSAAATAASLGRVATGAEAATAGLAGLSAAEESATVGMGTMNAAASTLAARGMAGVRSAGSGLMSMFGGPWGLALIGGVVAVTSLTSALKDQAAAEKQATEIGKALQQTYIQLGTIYGQKASAAREQAKEQSGLNDALKTAGVSQQTYTEALEGNVGAQKKVTDALDSAGTRTKMLLNGQMGIGDLLTDNTGKYLDVAKKMFDQINGSTSTFDLFNRHVSAGGTALQSLHTDADRIFGKNSLLDPAKSTLGKGMDELASSAGNTQKSLQGISDILDGLTGHGVSAAQATADLTQATVDLSHGFDDLGKGALDAKGNIDLNSEAGAELFHNLQQLGGGFKTAVNEAYSAAGGINNAAAASQAAGKAASQLYTKFMLTATGAGMSQQAAAELAKQLGLVPGDVVTDFTQPGMSEAQSAADILRGKIEQIPKSKDVKVDALTDSAVQELGALGFKVTHMKDGSFRVAADTAAARRELATIISDYQHYPINLIAHAVVGKSALAQAAGGVVHAYARGGIEPLSAGIAQVVHPGTLRIIGDRVRDDEFYIPDNTDPRSLAIGKEYVRRHPEVAAPVRTRELVAAGGGGGAAAIDYRQLAAALAAAIPDRPTVNVERWESTDGQTPYENAEALAFISRTRS